VLSPKDLEMLQHVLTSAWFYSPEKFLKSVLARTGQSFEGVVSFGFHHEYPEEIPYGVGLSYFEDELVLDDASFDREVLAFAKGKGFPRELEPLIDALTARVAAA
jgi:hypothetical protein